MLYKNFKDIVKRIVAAEDSSPDRRDLSIFLELNKPLKNNLRLLNHFITRTTAITSFGWSIIDTTKSFKDYDRLMIRTKKTINYILNNHCYATLFGKSLFKLNLINDNNGSALKIEKSVPNTDFTSDINNIYLYENNVFREKTETETINYLLDDVQYLPFAGIMRAITMFEIIRFDMIMENANFLRKVKGILQIIDKGASSDSSNSAALAAQTAIQNNYVITDEYVEFRLNQIAASSGASFKEYIDMLNNDISIAVLGQANTTQLPNNGGSRAALQVLQLISKDIFYSDMVRIETLINEYLQRDFKLNYGTGVMPYKFTLNYFEDTDPEKNASILETIVRIMPVRQDEAYKLVNLTPPKDGESVIDLSTL